MQPLTSEAVQSLSLTFSITVSANMMLSNLVYSKLGMDLYTCLNIL